MQHLLNVGPSAISNYMTRGRLPERAKPIIYAALTQKGYQIRADDLGWPTHQISAPAA